MAKDESVQGGNRELSFDYRLVVENFKESPVDVRVVDRLPYSEREADLRVTLKAMVESLAAKMPSIFAASDPRASCVGRSRSRPGPPARRPGLSSTAISSSSIASWWSRRAAASQVLRQETSLSSMITCPHHQLRRMPQWRATSCAKSCSNSSSSAICGSKPSRSPERVRSGRRAVAPRF